MKNVWTMEEIAKIIKEQVALSTSSLIAQLSEGQLDNDKIKQTASEIQALNKFGILLGKREDTNGN